MTRSTEVLAASNKAVRDKATSSQSTATQKAPYLPKFKRKGGVNFVLTERDLHILYALGRYRYLRTGQVARLIFPQSKTVQSARRRLKYLYHAGFVGRIQPIADNPTSQPEMAYFLEAAGAELLDEDTLPRFSRKGMVKPLFLRHALDLSEFRLKLELAVEALEGITLKRAVMDYELKTQTEKAVGKRRYRLFDEVLDPIGKRKLIVHPDLMFILESELDDGRVFRRLFFVEVDRGTEGLRVIKDKLTGYSLYRRESVFKKFGDFSDFRVLIQTNSPKRCANIQKLVGEFADGVDAWVTTDNLIEPESVLQGVIWRDSKSELKTILR